MKDTIRTRIGRILTGTAHSIVNAIEGLAPEVILERAIDEVDSAIDEAKVEQGRLKAQIHHVNQANLKLNTEHDRISEQLLVAKAEGRNDLLEAAISRQLDIEDQLPALQQQFEQLTHEHDELERAATGLIAKRNEMENELFEFKQNQAQAATGSGASSHATSSQPIDKADRADRAFSRVIQNATGVRRERLQANSAEAEQLLELAKLSKKARIEERLQQLNKESSA